MNFEARIAERCWDGSQKEILGLTDQKDFFLAGFYSGWSASVEADRQSVLRRLDDIFTASSEAGRARPQTSEAGQHSSLNQEMPGVSASGRSAAETPPLPSLVQDGLREERGPLPAGRRASR